MQNISPDMIDLLNLFEKYKVVYALCGGFAVSHYGFLRTTMDLDLLILPSKENAKNIMKALIDFGFGNAGIPEEKLTVCGTVITLGAQPNQIDLLTSISQENIEKIFAEVSKVRIWEREVPIISKKSLLQAKKESNRAKDKIDYLELQRIEEIEKIEEKNRKCKDEK